MPYDPETGEVTPDIICKTMEEYRNLPMPYGKVIQVPWEAL